MERLSLLSSGLIIYSGATMLSYTRDASSASVGRAILIYFCLVGFAIGIFLLPWIRLYSGIIKDMIEEIGFKNRIADFCNRLRGNNKNQETDDNKDKEETREASSTENPFSAVDQDQKANNGVHSIEKKSNRT
eukprot:TRINITY_DN4526_c0_g1_i11.p3 TRINITY_DN4526_c0_g1~~TRINITY_DN4526_c0_g1_i11.p3  ORF type:complete len:133 (-),score=16.05 TRINITY_DN4526_c0_g1_i11:250-648(-)